MRRTKTVVVLAGLVLIAGITGSLMFFKGNPKMSAVTIKQAGNKSHDRIEVENDVAGLRHTIDNLTGWGGYDNLAAGELNAWAEFRTETDLQRAPLQIEELLPSCDDMNSLTQEKLVADCKNLEALYNIASQNNNQTGAEALKLYHRVCEDMNYFFTGDGEEYGVSHIQGGFQVVTQFIQKSTSQ